MFNPISIFSSIDAFLHDVYSFFKFCILIDGLFFRLAKNTEIAPRNIIYLEWKRT